MQYMIVIVENETEWGNAGPADRERTTAAYGKYTQDLQKAGIMLGGEALLPSSKGARVKVRDGKRAVKDGPFSEAKEVIGGFYIIQVKSKEEAIEWASRCPAAQSGEVEVREVMEMAKK